MKTIAGSALVLGATVCLSVSAAEQTPVGALAIDERQGDQYGRAVDYETAVAAGTMALSECGSGCSVVLTFGRCAAYAADQDADSTAVAGRNRSRRRTVRARRRWASAARGAARGASFGCGAATATWSRKGWAWTVRRVVRFTRACRPPGSTRVVLTGCSVHGLGLRSGAGRRPGVLVRRATWTRRSSRRIWVGSPTGCSAIAMFGAVAFVCSSGGREVAG